MRRQTLLDAITWLDLHGTTVQAFAALATVALSLVIIAVALWAAVSAGRQARRAARLVEIAQEQVREAIEARRATMRPYVHVDTHVSVGGRVGGVGDKMGVQVALRNVGHGPALSVRPRLEHPWIRFAAPTGRPDGAGGTIEVGDPHAADEASVFLLEPGPERRLVRFALVEASGGHAALDDARLFVEYRDLLDRWWRTEAAIHFSARLGPDGFTDITAVALDQQERTLLIAAPTIEPGRAFRDGA
ncbi:MAG TPA: hypothetical protein VGL23_06360 [Chloroflexota bacterium]